MGRTGRDTQAYTDRRNMGGTGHADKRHTRVNRTHLLTHTWLKVINWKPNKPTTIWNTKDHRKHCIRRWICFDDTGVAQPSYDTHIRYMEQRILSGHVHLNLRTMTHSTVTWSKLHNVSSFLHRFVMLTLMLHNTLIAPFNDWYQQHRANHFTTIYISAADNFWTN